MATKYLDTDTGSDGTGDGSEGNKWATLAYAKANTSNYDSIIVSGATIDTYTISADDSFLRNVIINPDSAVHEYHLELNATSAVAVFEFETTYFYGITMSLHTSSLSSFAFAIQEGSLISRCKFIAYSGQILPVVKGDNSNGSASWMENCDFDGTGFVGSSTESFIRFGLTSTSATRYSSMIMNGCSFYNFSNTGTVVLHPGGLINRCKFWNNTNSGTIIEMKSGNYDRTLMVSNCSLLVEDATKTFIQNNDAESKISFSGNAIDVNFVGGYSNVFSSSSTVVGFLGNNIIRDTVTIGYSNLTSPDLTDTGALFDSNTFGDVDFLRLSTSSNGKYASILNSPNGDLGAIQGDPAVLFPALGEVKTGISFGLTPTGDRTGTRTDAVEADVLLGEQYGSDGTEFTGTLVNPPAPNNYDVREGIIVGDVTGILKVPTIAQVEDGVTFDRTDAPLTGTQTPLAPQQGPFTVTVYTSDGSNISGTTASPTITVEVESGVLVDTILSDLGASETYATGTTLIRNTGNNRRLDIRIDR